MIYLSTNNLKKGMIIGRSVSYGNSYVPLVTTGQKLTFDIIKKLEDRHIIGVYIKSNFFDDIENESFISPEYKDTMNKEIKNIYKDFIGEKSFNGKAEKEIKKVAESLINLVLSKEECILNVIEIKSYDNYTYSHSMNVGILAVLIGNKMGYSTSVLTDLAMAGFLHDIGKLDISLDIINKPDELTEDEFDKIKEHPKHAVSRLKYSSQIMSAALMGIGSHHEKYNGEGYPNGLIGDDIPLYGRILAIADVYDAITSGRSYRRAWYPHEAIEYMMCGATTHFDYELLMAFLKTVAAYPIGTIVELSNEEVGVVIQNHSDYTLRPTVKIVFPEEKRGTKLDLSSDMNYLNITISNIITDISNFPGDLFT